MTTPRRKFSTSWKESSLSTLDDDLDQSKNPSNLPTHMRPLSSQIGQDMYNFRTMSQIDSRFTSDPTTPRQTAFDENRVPEDADSLDIINMLREEQRVELETALDGVNDDSQRSFIIYQSAITFQSRLGKLRNVRKEQKRILGQQVRTGLDAMKQNATQLSALDLISLLRGISIGDPHLKLYTLDHVSNLQDYMLFFSCRDQTHLSLVANAIVDFVSTHPKFNIEDDNNTKNTTNNAEDDANNNNTNGVRGVKKVNARANTIAGMTGAGGNSGNGSSTSGTDPKHTGRKFGELLIFSRHDLPWRLIDLGSVLLHLSYGPERKLGDMESVLTQYTLDLGNKTVQTALAKGKLHKCLEITPVSQLEEDATLLPLTKSPTPQEQQIGQDIELGTGEVPQRY